MFGSGNNAIGNTSAITEALARRKSGGSVSPLSQVSEASPSFQGQPPQAGTPSMGIRAPQSQGTMGVGGMPANSGESQIIVKALRDRLNLLGKIESGGMGGM